MSSTAPVVLNIGTSQKINSHVRQGAVAPDFKPLEPAFKAAGVIDPRQRIQIEPPALPKLTGAEDDVGAIQRTASAIDELLTEANTVQNYIAQGHEYKKLHEQLARNSKSDKTRIGWYTAFEQKPGLPHSRRQAEDLIAICRAFLGTVAPSKLPQSLRSLRLLARLLNEEKLTYSELQNHLDSKKIHPLSTEAEIRELLGLKKNATGDPTGTAAAPDIIQSLPIRELLRLLSSDQRRELIALVVGEHAGSPAAIKAATEITTELLKNRKVAHIIADAGFTPDNFKVVFQVRLH